MDGMKKLLIVAHAPSPNTLRLREAVDEGARHEDIENVEVTVLAPLDAGPDDVLACLLPITFAPAMTARAPSGQ